MKRSGTCPKCGSTNVIADARAVDRAHLNAQTELSVATFRSPKALVFKGQVTSTVSAWICSDCGFVEFYADDPRKLDR